MENVQTLDYDNEIEIDLKDLCLELLSFWKLILLALVGCGGLHHRLVGHNPLCLPEQEKEAYQDTQT